MFNKCCAANISPTGKLNQRPLFIKLGGPRKNQGDRLNSCRNKIQDDIQQSIIKQLNFSRIQSSSGNGLNENLGQSALNDLGLKDFTQHNLTQDKQNMHERQPLKLLAPKYNNLQSKYISTLQQRNDYLQKILLKSRSSSQSQFMNRSQSGKIGAQLIQLKQRLNNIDLTNITKIARYDKAKLSQASQENKQNLRSNTFKQLRLKLN